MEDIERRIKQHILVLSRMVREGHVILRGLLVAHEEAQKERKK